MAAAVVALLVLAQWIRGRRLVAAYGGREPARRLLGRDLSRLPFLRLFAGAAAVAALVLAASDPQPEEGEEPPPPTPVDLVVLVDVSHSMSAADVGTRRIDRARELIDEIIEERAADRIGLAIFADWPYTLVPLTDDPDVVTFFGPWLNPELVGTRDQGTSLPAALGRARVIWDARSREDARRIVLLISDAEIHEGLDEVLDSVTAISDAGFEVWTAGVGSSEGAPLFVPGSGEAPLLYDGEPVIAGYDEALLREIAEQGRGSWHDVSSEGGARSVVAELTRDRPVGDGSSDVNWRPALWLLVAALILLLVEAASDLGRARRRPA
jgi:Ca-activated chloride channel family protein